MSLVVLAWFSFKKYYLEILSPEFFLHPGECEQNVCAVCKTGLKRERTRQQKVFASGELHFAPR